jgi:hypothetical protein
VGQPQSEAFGFWFVVYTWLIERVVKNDDYAMARPLRLEFAGALYHITSRGDRREDIYEEDADRLAILTLLDDVCDTYNWLCHAYCLMSDLSHRRVGQVFQGRYKAILVEKQSYLLEVRLNATSGLWQRVRDSPLCGAI